MAQAALPILSNWQIQGGWELVEVVGLPVDARNPNVANLYDSGLQGLVNLVNPAPRDQPFDAAMRRLNGGAPRFGWRSFSNGTASLPDWQPPDVGGYLKDLVKGRLFNGLLEMLGEHPNPLEPCELYLDEVDPARRAYRRVCW